MLNIQEIGFKFQARMQPLKTDGADSRGTFLMAFVLTDADSDTVQVGNIRDRVISFYTNVIRGFWMSPKSSKERFLFRSS